MIPKYNYLGIVYESTKKFTYLPSFSSADVPKGSVGGLDIFSKFLRIFATLTNGISSGLDMILNVLTWKIKIYRAETPDNEIKISVYFIQLVKKNQN